MKTRYKILLISIIIGWLVYFISTASIYSQEIPCDVGFETMIFGYCMPRISMTG